MGFGQFLSWHTKKPHRATGEREAGTEESVGKKIHRLFSKLFRKLKLCNNMRLWSRIPSSSHFSIWHDSHEPVTRTIKLLWTLDILMGIGVSRPPTNYIWTCWWYNAQVSFFLRCIGAHLKKTESIQILVTPGFWWLMRGLHLNFQYDNDLCAGCTNHRIPTILIIMLGCWVITPSK